MMKLTAKGIVKTLLLLTLLVLSAAPAYAKILIVSPHPDDDIITSSGIIYRAIARGEPVKVVFMTNGDFNGQQTGYLREAEAVAAEGALGLAEENLIFLGYPDGYLLTICSSYTGESDLFTDPGGISATYGNRGLGLMDYHSYRFGTPGNYNRFNILKDLQDLISTYRPDHIFVPSEFDAHPDHATSYNLLTMAVSAVAAGNAGYAPVIEKTIIGWSHGTGWPNPGDPTAYFTAIPDLELYTNLVWADRESIDVPLAMQSTDYPSNPKYLAISAHASQGGPEGLLSYALHKDEYFWPENILGTNHPPIVNAGNDQTVKPGDAVYLEGSQSKDPDGDTLTFQWVQRSGTPVTLTGATTAAPAFAAPTGPNPVETLTFELTVSDGQFTSAADAVSVRVDSRSNIAPLATVTASSQNPLAEQTADKAVDGIIDGYPGDVTREWATVGEGVGAWIKLSWPVPYVISRIVLYDRPNLNDGITSATLTFNDGTTAAIGPLNNDGSPTEPVYPPKVITDLTLTVTGVSSTTTNVGLAELQVYGYASSQTQYSVTVNEFPAGAGTVAVTPDKATYYQGEQVTLTATPSSGYLFSSWSGDATGTAGQLTVTVDANKTITANFTPFGLNSISVNPAGVTGGTTAQGTVTLNGPAPRGGAVVALSGNSSAATVQESVTIPESSTSATFTVATTPVATSTAVTISAAYAGVSKSATLTVNQPVLTSLSIAPGTVTSGTPSQGTARLNGPAPAGGITVSLSSNKGTVAAVPSGVIVAEGSTTASFGITTYSITKSTPVTIAAACGGVSQTAKLTVNAPAGGTVALTLSPATVTGGASSMGTVKLSAAAPTGGLVITLRADQGVNMPASVTVPIGATTATFIIDTVPVAVATPVIISASNGTSTATATLTVNPPALTALTFSMSSILGGTSSTGTATISGPAPSGGLIVLLAGNSSAVAVPESVAIPQGAAAATFTITTTPVAAATPVTISASSAGVTKTAILTVNPLGLSSLTLSPASVRGGTTSRGTVTLNGPAPLGGITIALSDNSSNVTVPASVTISEGSSSTTFAITTTSVKRQTTAAISASYGGATATATLKLTK